MITLKEALRGRKESDIAPEVLNNFKALIDKINVIRKAYGKPMTVTSGIRTEEEQKCINPKSMKSNHLTGHAIDIADKDGSLYSWCMGNTNIAEDLGLYFEDKSVTPTWIHIQSLPPKSGKRVFKP